MIKTELHCHTIGGSICADTPMEIMAERYAQAGYNALVVTNHFSKWSIETVYPDTDKKGKTDYFFSLVDKFGEICAAKNMRVFFGAEVRSIVDNTEYMLLGFDRSFVYDNDYLFNFSQQELFELADKNGVLMYQSHPFRAGVVAGNPAFLHGAESFNGHFHHKNDNELAEEFCKKNGLIMLSGTDFHHKDQPITGGIYLPDDIKDERDIVKCIRGGNYTAIEMKEEYLRAYKKYKGLE